MPGSAVRPQRDLWVLPGAVEMARQKAIQHQLPAQQMQLRLSPHVLPKRQRKAVAADIYDFRRFKLRLTWRVEFVPQSGTPTKHRPHVAVWVARYCAHVEWPMFRLSPFKLCGWVSECN